MASQKKSHKNISPLSKTGLNVKSLENRLPPKTKRSHHIVVKLKGVSKTFKVGDNEIHALKETDLNIYSGEFVIVYGPSGSGKSTFLHTILGLEPPTTGSVLLRKRSLYAMNTEQRTEYRRKKIGMMFQQSNWIKSLNVLENVAYPLWLDGKEEKQSRKKALELLDEVDMKQYADHKPTELSGGQQQRVALARALAINPWIIIADEPTGNLDTKSSAQVLELLAKLNRDKSRLIIMVTHELQYLDIATRRIGVKDGEIVYDEHD